jgi:HAE1 family hydrophobic/amphiphilic exporter-1
MMTTLTTVLGLLPMALGLGEGSEMRTPMAVTVIGGLLTSTLLTLVVVPVMYSLLDRRKDTRVEAPAPSEKGTGGNVSQSRIIPAG